MCMRGSGEWVYIHDYICYLIDICKCFFHYSWLLFIDILLYVYSCI